ncbi:unnamed protein product [Lampetra planeri]
MEAAEATAPHSAGPAAHQTRGSPSPPGSSRPGPAAAAALAELGRVLDASKALVSELETLVAFTNPDGEFVKTLGQVSDTSPFVPRS